MIHDTSTLIIQFVLLAAIILAPWLYKGARARFVPLRFEAQGVGPGGVCDQQFPMFGPLRNDSRF